MAGSCWSIHSPTDRRTSVAEGSDFSAIVTVVRLPLRLVHLSRGGVSLSHVKVCLYPAEGPEPEGVPEREGIMNGCQPH